LSPFVPLCPSPQTGNWQPVFSSEWDVSGQLGRNIPTCSNSTPPPRSLPLSLFSRASTLSFFVLVLLASLGFRDDCGGCETSTSLAFLPFNESHHPTSTPLFKICGIYGVAVTSKLNHPVPVPYPLLLSLCLSDTRYITPTPGDLAPRHSHPIFL